MITIFNRKELAITFSMEKQAEIRRILSQNKIDYTIKTINRKSPSPIGGATRGRTGTYGENLDFAYEYIFYVDKKDYEIAKHLI